MNKKTLQHKHTNKIQLSVMLRVLFLCIDYKLIYRLLYTTKKLYKRQQKSIVLYKYFHFTMKTIQILMGIVKNITYNYRYKGKFIIDMKLTQRTI